MRRVKAKIVSGGQDDASMQLEWLWAEIKSRFGVCPSFFKSAQPEPLIARQLFQIAELGYLDSPIPELFKEKLFTWLSRFCNVRYCVARHCAFLLGRGVTAEQALALLNEPMPGKAELSACLRALEEVPAPLGDWPDFDSDLGRCIRVACAVVMLQPVRAAVWLRALHQLLGPQRYEQLMLFVAFVRTAHFWTQIHPELKFEPDLEAMLHEHESFAEPLLRGGDEATRWQPGHPFRDEMKSQRETQKSMEAIRDNAARFGAIFENAAVGIARVSPDGWFLEVNGRFCEIVGYAREDLMTKTFGDITILMPT